MAPTVPGDDVRIDANVDIPPVLAGAGSAPELTDGQKRISLSTVTEAAAALKAVGLGRADAMFDRWLLRKRCGLWVPAPGDDATDVPAVVGPEDCAAYARDLLAVGAQYVSPFTLKPKGATGASDWPMQTFFTQVQRINQTEQALFRPAEEVEPADGDGAARRKRYRISVVSSNTYWARLPTLLGGKRVPLEAAALWRFRLEPVPEGTTTEDLVERFLDEFKISPPEAELLFVRSTEEGTS